ncbi:MAG TPA: type II toxin-antitoxin system Phd/YefM family antitoxin [Anaerolineales bacterium]|nr:type II toxin-antitoxin system Phd/YefM family antitoxin [Anaerolineales bacterium]
MERTISATQARIHFGEIMKQAKIGPVIVERDGKAEVVVISKKTYDQLMAANTRTDLQKRLENLHAQIRVELAGRTLPDPAEIIRQGREERDEQLLNNLR